MHRTTTLFVAAMALCALFAQAQTSQVSLSNLYVTITQPGDSSLQVAATQYANDSASVSNSIQLNVRFEISAPSAVKRIELQYGDGMAASNFLSMDMTAVSILGKRYLMHNNVLFEIQNGRVHICRLVSADILRWPGYLRVKGYDLAESPTNTLSKNNMR